MILNGRDLDEHVRVTRQRRMDAIERDRRELERLAEQTRRMEAERPDDRQDWRLRK